MNSQAVSCRQLAALLDQEIGLNFRLLSFSCQPNEFLQLTVWNQLSEKAASRPWKIFSRYEQEPINLWRFVEMQTCSYYPLSLHRSPLCPVWPVQSSHPMNTRYSISPHFPAHLTQLSLTEQRYYLKASGSLGSSPLWKIFAQWPLGRPFSSNRSWETTILLPLVLSESLAVCWTRPAVVTGQGSA